MKTLKLFLLTAIVSFTFSQFANAQKVRITTTVNNFNTTSILLGCPSYGENSALIIDLTTSDKLADITTGEAARLEDLITAFESENGARVSSRTQTRNFQTEEDNIESTTTGPLSGAGKDLCDFVNDLIGN